MYDELVERLRAEIYTLEDLSIILPKAADAIEELRRENESLAKSVNEASEILRKRWIPVTTRPMDKEERLEWSEKLGYDIEDDEALIYNSQLPDDGQEVLVCGRYGQRWIDTFENDPDYGCSFEENGDMDGIVAWMPLPEPYTGERKDNE